MAEIVAEVFDLSGVSETPPSTLAELVPWLVKVTVGVVCVSGAFRFLGKLTELFQWRRW